MPWCPKCKNEYVEGKTHCPDCDVDLIAEPVEETPEEEPVFAMPEPSELDGEFIMEDMLDGPVKKPAASKVFKSVEERYSDARSTATAFFCVGGIGLIVMILALTGVIHLPVHDFALYSMSLFFLIFLLIGWLSQKNSKKILTGLNTEHALIQKITDWYETEGVHSDSLKALMKTASPETLEVVYLQKYELIRRMLHTQFPDTDGSLLDKLASDFSEDTRMDAMMEEDIRLMAAIEEQLARRKNL